MMSGYDPTKDFKILRAVSYLMITLGIVMIVGGVFSSFFVFASSREIFAQWFASDGGSKYNMVSNGASVFGAIVWSVFWLGIGLLQVAASQIILVFLDIRDDTRKTLQFLIKNK